VSFSPRVLCEVPANGLLPRFEKLVEGGADPDLVAAARAPLDRHQERFSVLLGSAGSVAPAEEYAARSARALELIAVALTGSVRNALESPAIRLLTTP
jgi:hypothetical protein